MDRREYLQIVDTWPRKWRDRYVQLRVTMKIKPAYQRTLAEKTVTEELARKKRPARVPGGLASRKHPRDFPFEALVRGTIVELEHTGDPRVAMEISMDHLVEDLRYYEKLAKIEKHSNPTYKRLMR